MYTHTQTHRTAKEIKYNELDSIQKAEKTLEQAEQTIINIINFIVFISSFFSSSLILFHSTKLIYFFSSTDVIAIEKKPNEEKMKRLCIQVLEWLTLVCYFY